MQSTAAMHRILLLAAAAIASMATSRVDPVPEPDECVDPGAAALSSLEIGPLSEPFAPFSDGDVADVVLGGQGGEMIGVRLMMRGDVPACVDQITTLVRCDSDDPQSCQDPSAEPIGELAIPLATYDADGGAFTTGEMWIILWTTIEYGQWARLDATVGDTSTSAMIRLGEPY